MFKKIGLLVFSLIGLFMMMVVPVYAQSGSGGCGQLEGQFEQLRGSDAVANLPRYCSIFSAFEKFFSVASYIAGGLAVLLVVVGGFQYMTAAGNEKQATNGKNTVLYSLVGLIVIIMAKALVAIVANFLAK